MPREQIWKNSQLLSMDQLLEFDEEESAAQEQQPVAKDIHEPVQEVRAPVIEEKQHIHSHQQQQHRPRHQQKTPRQPKGFNTSEALSLLLNIQKSSDDAKFDLIDGFLDKYKVR